MQSSAAALTGALIAVLGGMVGLGGGEFRLPAITQIFGRPTRSAIPLNLIVSLITIVSSLIARANTLSLTGVTPFLWEVSGLGIGAIFGARWAADRLSGLSDSRIDILVSGLLVAIGILLLAEAALPISPSGIIPRSPAWLLLSGAALGTSIGAVASILGVAGGELLIPTLLFIYGVDIRTAGTASLLVSVAAVATGLLTYWRNDRLPARDAIRSIALPMGLGSVFGAAIGGLLAGIVPTAGLKTFLGSVLLAAAWVGLRRRAQGNA